MTHISRSLKCVSQNPILLEVGRKAIEDTLVQLRDGRISFPTRGNGLVIREKDGTRSPAIRLGSEDALRIGLRAIAEYIEQKNNERSTT